MRQRQRSPGGSFVPADEAIDVVVTRLEVSLAAVDAAAALLSDVERKRAGRFAFDRDRNRFIVARAQLRKLLASRLGVRPELVELVYGVHGKPELAQRFAPSRLRFNISHSEDFAVFAFSRDREIGIDVEAVREIPDADDIAARYFSRREIETYLALDPRDKLLGFYNCWTRKEAFIKALGAGLYYPLDSFDVSLAPGESAKILRVENTPGDECGFSLRSFSPARDFVAALVTGSPTRNADVSVSLQRPVRMEITS